jgi:hypothetical protein
MRLQVIQLEPYDDVVSVRDRLAFVRAERVLLVWPRTPADSPPILRRKLDLVLISRECARRKLRFALVCSHPDVIEAANDLGLSVFASLEESQRHRWKTPSIRLFTSRVERPPDEPDAYERHALRLRASRLLTLSPQQRRWRQIGRAAAVAALLVTALILAVTLLPAAEVIVTPASGQIETALPIIADPNATLIDAENGRVPARTETLEVEAQAVIPPRQRREVPDGRAVGTVVFTNLVESAVTVPAGTLLTTTGAAPARFRTLDEITLPAGVGQRRSVAIQAEPESAGPVGNVQAGLIINIEGNLSRAIAVRNPEPTSGGTVREQGIVSVADHNTLLDLARGQLVQIALARLSERISGDQIIVPDSIRVRNPGLEELAYSAFPGDPADRVGLTMRARVSALIIDESAARQVALARLSREIPAGQRLLIDTIRYARTPLAPPDADGRVVFLVTASAAVTSTIDREWARQRIAGQPVEAAIAILNRDWLLDPLRPPEVQVYPALFGRLPLLPVRISIVIRTVAGNGP